MFIEGRKKPGKYEKYVGKTPEQYSGFADKIICARVNYYKGKKLSLGLSQEVAAKKIGITKPYLSGLESGKKQNPAAIILYKLEKLYGFRQGELAKLLIDDKKAAI